MARARVGDLEAIIRSRLSSFYKRRIQALDGLDLTTVLSRKNPYLFRAKGMSNATEMVRELLAAHISSSDEAIFADEFFEPICKAVSQKVIQVAGARGADFAVETDDTYEVISLKSGPNAFNSSQVEKQNEHFEGIERSVRATLRNLRKQFIPILGCAYGRVDSEPTRSRRYYKLAGQAFWHRVTGDDTFYLKLVSLMKGDPDKHKPVFKEAWDKAENRFVRDFTEGFCSRDGTILWDRLVKFNSGKQE